MGQETGPHAVVVQDEKLLSNGIRTYKSKPDTAKPDYLRKSDLYRTILVALLIVICALLISTIVLAVKVLRCGPDASVRASSVPDPCPEGWIWYRWKCYFFSGNSSDWDEAQSFCTSHNASLAHIETKQELAFAIRYKGDFDYWIGLRRQEQGQTWKWTDGSEFNNLFDTPLEESGCVYLNDVKPRVASCTMNRRWTCTKPSCSNL